MIHSSKSPDKNNRVWNSKLQAQTHPTELCGLQNRLVSHSKILTALHGLHNMTNSSASSWEGTIYTYSFQWLNFTDYLRMTQISFWRKPDTNKWRLGCALSYHSESNQATGPRFTKKATPADMTAHIPWSSGQHLMLCQLTSYIFIFRVIANYCNG